MMNKAKKGGNWKSQSPTRSNTASTIRGRISAPIPLISDDEEFPIRKPGATIATPIAVEGNEKQLGRTPPARPTTPNPATGIAISDFQEPMRPAPKPPVQAVRDSTQAPSRDTNGSSNLRTSYTSNRSTQNSGKPQRKKSSFKTVFGRLFGKKRKSAASASPRRSASIRREQRRSDPSALQRSPGASSLQKRTVSLPAAELKRALGSHTPFPGGSIGHVLQSTNDRSSSLVDGNTPRSKPRRATTPSKIYTPEKGPGYVDWTGLSPRPSSIPAKCAQTAEADESRVAIGTAITSGSHPNRRSRSVGQLRGITTSLNTTRRRSDEIRYWRESYEPRSPQSSNRPETADREHNGIDTGLPAKEVPGPVEVAREESPMPFNFGSLGSEMAGMKITQAASLEERVSRIENRMQNMEALVEDLRSRIFLHRSQDPEAESHGSLSHDPERAPRQQRSKSHDLEPPPRSLRRSPVRQNSSLLRQDAGVEDRPSSTATVLGPASTPWRITGENALINDENKDPDPYHTLLKLITAEQQARRSLESKVAELQIQVHALRASNEASAHHLDLDTGAETGRNSEYYPTPSPELVAPGNASAFAGGDQSDDEVYSHGGYPFTERAAETQVYPYPTPEGYGSDSGYKDEEAHSDAFQTPVEERSGYAYGGVDVPTNGDDRKMQRVSALESSKPRTLSLSQLTLGTGTRKT